MLWVNTGLVRMFVGVLLFFPARVSHFISENSGDFFCLVVGRILVQNTSAAMGGVKLLRRIPAESLSPEQRTTTWEMNYP